MASRPIRVVLYGLLLLIAVVALAAWVAPPIVVDDEHRDVTIAAMDATLAALRQETSEQGPLVIVLGDSSLGWHLTLGPEDALRTMLEKEGGRTGRPVRVVQRDGFDAVAYYLLVDEIAALHPAAVVLTANLQSFTDDWFGRVRMKHPQLAAFVRPWRVPAAMQLPLDLAGVTDASLVVKPVFRALGASDVPEAIDGYRTRIREGLDAWLKEPSKRALVDRGIAWAEPPPNPAPAVVAAPPPAVPAPAPPAPGTVQPVPAAPPAPGVAPPGVVPPAAGAVAPAPGVAPPAPAAVPPPAAVGPRARPPVIAKGAYRFMDLYPENLGADQATVRVFAATVRDLVARGVPTVVFLAPLHLQAAKVTGAYQTRKLPQAVQVVQTMTTENGGHFVDLAEVLPQESYFVDRYSHFTTDGNAIVRDKLLDALAGFLGERAGHAPSDPSPTTP